MSKKYLNDPSLKDDAYIINLFIKRAKHIKDKTMILGAESSPTPTQVQDVSGLFGNDSAEDYDRNDVFFGNIEDDMYYVDSEEEDDGDGNSDSDDDEEEVKINKINLLKFCKLSNPALQGEKFSRSAFQDQFKSLFNNEYLSDVVFLAKDKEGAQKKIYAHKLILKTRSKYFKRMFRSGMKEAQSKEVPIDTVQYEILLSLIGYLYTGVLKITYESALLVLAAANHFQMNDVKEIIAEYFKEVIDSETACLLYEESFFHNATDLKMLCLSYIEDEAEKVINSEAFKEMTTEMVLGILKSDNLCVDEYQLFEGCIDWAKAQAAADEGSDYKDFFAKIVSSIRFPRMKATELRDKIEKDYAELVPLDYILEAYRYHSIPSSVNNERTRDRVARSSFTWEGKKSSYVSVRNNGKTVRMTSTSKRSSTVLGNVKWQKGIHYFQVKLDDCPSSSDIMIGVVDEARVNTESFLSHNSRGWAVYTRGSKYHNSSSSAYFKKNLKKGDVIGVHLDLDKGEISFYLNGKSYGIAYKGVSGPVSPAITLYAPNDQVSLLSGRMPSQ